MIDGPRRLNLDARLVAPDLATAAARLFAAIDAAPGLAAPTGWAFDEFAPPRGGRPAPADLAGTRRLALSYALPADTGDLYALGEPAAGWALNLVLDADARDAAAVEAMLAGLLELCRALLAAGALGEAVVRRHLGGDCLPEPPLAGTATHLAVVATADVQAAYRDAAAFRSAWEFVEDHGDRVLVARGLGAPGNPAFLRAIHDGQMAMARAAPGATRFFAPNFAAGEFEWLDGGEPTLTGVGYFADEQAYEFAGHLPGSTELRALDLLTAWRVASTGAVEIEGVARPVRIVRAVFMDEGQARRAEPLLAAAGVRACWMSATGDLRDA